MQGFGGECLWFCVATSDNRFGNFGIYGTLVSSKNRRLDEFVFLSAILVSRSGVLSYVATEALKNPKPYNSQGELTASALEAHIYNEVPKLSDKQEPVIEYARKPNAELIIAKWVERKRQRVQIRFVPPLLGANLLKRLSFRLQFLLRHNPGADRQSFDRIVRCCRSLVPLPVMARSVLQGIKLQLERRSIPMQPFQS